MKKRTIILISIFVLALVGGGGYGIFHLIQNGGDPVAVTSVAYLNQGYWGGDMSSYGTITSKATQEIHLDSNELVDQVFVEEGDKVKVGDKLLSYDTTLLELDLEAYELEEQALELELKGAEKDLQKLKSTTPVADSTGSDVSDFSQWDDGDMGDVDEEYGDDDGEDEEARAVLNPLYITAASDGEAVIEDGGVSEDTEPVVEETPETDKQVITEAAAETALPETTAPAETNAPAETASSTETPASAETAASTETSAAQTPVRTETEASTELETKKAKTSKQQDISTVVLDPNSEDGILSSSDSDDPAEVKGEMKAQKVLNDRTEPYKGSGTKEDPYVFFCAEGAVIQASFMNTILGFNAEGTSRDQGGIKQDGVGVYAILELRLSNLATNGTTRVILIDGTISEEKAFGENMSWNFTMDGFMRESVEGTDRNNDPSPDSLNYEDTDTFLEDLEAETTVTDQNGQPVTGDVTEIIIPGDEILGTSTDQELAEAVGSESGDESESGDQSEGGDENESGNQSESGDENESGSQSESGDENESGNQSESGDESETGDPSESGDESESGDSSESGDESETGDPSESGAVIDPSESEESEPVTEPATEPVTEPATEEEIEPSPLDLIKANKVLNYRTKPYKGEGTKENPYVFFCTDGAVIQASFMNKILGFNESGTSRVNGGMKGDGEGCYAILEIREGDEMSGGFVKSIQIKGTVPTDKAFAPDISWIFTTDGLQKIVPEIEEPETDDPNNYLDPDDPGFWDDPGDSYTVSELKQAIADKEAEIKDLKLSQREAELNTEKARRKLEEATVVSSIHGVVKKVGDPVLGEVDGEAFILVASDSGLYVQGTISEMDLEKVKVGTTLSGYSYESGVSFTAEITEISKYPSSADSWYSGSSNPNVSNYPFLAYIEEADGLSDYESAELQIQDEDSISEDSLYISKMYIRKENGQSYVYIKGSDGLLKKQYVRTGQTLYGDTVEIKEGLSINDSIAFPYGKNVKEGAKTKVSSEFADDEDEDSQNIDENLDDNFDEDGYDGFSEDGIEEYDFDMDEGEEYLGDD